MANMSMKIREMDINALIPYINNPRENDGAAVTAVAKSIREFGFKQPIVVDKNCVVVIGHTRLKAAKYLGYQVVPVVIADDLSDAEIKALRLVDNKTAEISRWRENELEMELDQLKEDGYDLPFPYFDYVPEEEEEEAPKGTSESTGVKEDDDGMIECPRCKARFER